MRPRTYSRRNLWLAVLVLASLFASAWPIVERLGIEATPSETTDSQGRPMGFNDPLSAEHHLIIARNFSLRALLRMERSYEWLLLAMHVAGLWLILSSHLRSRRAARWFFAAQPAIFPLGLVFCWSPPLLVIGRLTLPNCREGITDFPFLYGMAVQAHPIWVLVSLWMVWALRDTPFGAGGWWRSLGASARAKGCRACT